MEDNKEDEKKYVFDESKLDPRLRAASEKTLESESKTNTQAAFSGSISSPTGLTGRAPAPAPAPFPVYVPEGQGNSWWDAFEDDIIDEHTAFPESAYKSLDYIIASEGMRDDERTWLMGLQAGIGLGIHSAREAVLNEMHNENTVFSRRIQRDPSDPDPYQMRMELGRRCQEGFDRRVAYRAANRFIRSCNQIADRVVYSGLTECLPETGNHIIGTSMLFSDEDVARCHSNSEFINETLGIAESQPQPSLDLDDNSGANQPAPPTASFLGDGLRIGNVDMTQLTGTAALLANAVTYGPVPPNGQQMAEGQSTPDTALLNHELFPLENKDADVETEYEHIQEIGTPTPKPRAELGGRKAPRKAVKAVTRSMTGRRAKRTSHDSSENTAGSAGVFQPRAALVETASGRAVIKKTRLSKRKKQGEEK